MYKIFLIIALIAFSAVFSASETALTTVNKIRLKKYAEQGNKRAAKALKLSTDFDKSITAILIGNNIVNISSASISAVLFTGLLGDNGAWVSTLVMTVTVLIFGEILPKSIAKQNAEKLALAVAAPITILIKILKPFIYTMTKLSNFVSKVFSGGEKHPSYTEDELKYIVDEIEGQGVLEKEEGQLVRSALTFDEIALEEILIPRVKITAASVNTDIETVKKLFFEEMYSRIPVYEKNIDNIIGFLSAKIFFKCIERGETKISNMLQDILRFTEFTLLSDALSEMKRQKIHIAVVIDQYGGTAGLITMEDIIEELIGDIMDENDELSTEFVKLEENIYEISGGISISDLSEILGMVLESESNSAAGWVMEICGHIPNQNETIESEGLKITVLDVEDRKITSMRIAKIGK